MKPALGHVTCGLGGAGGLRLAVVGAGWLAVCVVRCVGVCVFVVMRAAGDVGCGGLVVEVVFFAFFFAGWRLDGVEIEWVG